jgi:hypothetical protein
MTRTVAYVLLVLAAVFAVAATGWRFGVDQTEASWQARWSQRDADESKLRADAVQAARTEEQRRFAAVSQVATDARTQTTVIDFGRSQLAVAADGLRFDANELSTRPTACSAAAPDRSRSATRAAMVLSDLLGRCSATLEELAPAYDRARNAGYACEQTYHSLSPPK